MKTSLYQTNCDFVDDEDQVWHFERNVNWKWFRLSGRVVVSYPEVRGSNAVFGKNFC